MDEYDYIILEYVKWKSVCRRISNEFKSLIKM
jgi:hypothetical protein